MPDRFNADGSPTEQTIRNAGGIPYASQIPNDSAYPGANVDDALDTLYATVGARKIVTIEALAVPTLNNEKSTALGLASTVQFTPTHAIMQMTAVGVGVAANGDVQISIGTSAGGTQIKTAGAATGLIGINTRYVWDLSGTVRAAIPGTATIYAKVTTADTTAGAGHTANVYVIGEITPTA